MNSSHTWSSCSGLKTVLLDPCLAWFYVCRWHLVWELKPKLSHDQTAPRCSLIVTTMGIPKPGNSWGVKSSSIRVSSTLKIAWTTKFITKNQQKSEISWSKQVSNFRKPQPCGMRLPQRSTWAPYLDHHNSLGRARHWGKPGFPTSDFADGCNPPVSKNFIAIDQFNAI